ncbi:c-type cytochrome [Niabella beijingensis]|uniref:c-type cytochrome n=1 Tax=Niabella beijingensis TaxID=2872700 RepID=UPI001CBA7345|nr:hypothetical protein [Niabella beijingensis]MBZ4189014.1 hypothetical protein [Niabella beijingensis]
MKKNSFFSTGILLACIAVSLANCGGDKENSIDNPPPADPCDGVNAKFAANVLPLIQAKCQGCHKTGGGAPFALETYDQIKAKASNIKDAAVTNSRMPKGGPALTAAEKKTLGCWIDGGAINN